MPEPLKSEIELATKQMRLGNTLEDALLEMARRIGSRVFDTALAISAVLAILTRGAVKAIWPESVFPFFMSQYPEGLARIGRMLPATTTLLTGAPREPDNDSGDPDDNPSGDRQR